MPPPIAKLAHDILDHPARIDVAPAKIAVERIDQRVYFVGAKEKRALLEALLADHAMDRVLVFTRTKRGADRVCRSLMQAGISVAALHGNKAQNARVRALDRALSLLADHEMATSTFGVRIAASTWADPYLLLLTGLAVVGGPLHGGASEFVRTARASGLSPAKVTVTYAFRNAMLPVITPLSMVFSFLLGANVLVEKVFAWPGIGSYAVEALISSDFAPVQGFVLTMAIMYVMLNLGIDILYGVIDPRVRLEG